MKAVLTEDEVCVLTCENGISFKLSYAALYFKAVRIYFWHF